MTETDRSLQPMETARLGEYRIFADTRPTRSVCRIFADTD